MPIIGLLLSIFSSENFSFLYISFFANNDLLNTLLTLSLFLSLDIFDKWRSFETFFKDFSWLGVIENLESSVFERAEDLKCFSIATIP